jgi:iron(II)-dependent oxidoreductase
MPLCWVPVPGGTIRYGETARPEYVGDLEVALTPLTYGQVNQPGEPDMPVTGINHAEARRLADLVGGRLPTSAEWEWLAAGTQQRPFPWGSQPWSPTLARLSGPTTHHDAPCPVGEYADGATPDGLLDLAGNVWEWTASLTPDGAYIIRGGSYASKPLCGRSTFVAVTHAERRSSDIGLRPVRTS